MYSASGPDQAVLPITTVPGAVDLLDAPAAAASGYLAKGNAALPIWLFAALYFASGGLYLFYWVYRCYRDHAPTASVR